MLYWIMLFFKANGRTELQSGIVYGKQRESVSAESVSASANQPFLFEGMLQRFKTVHYCV